LTSASFGAGAGEVGRERRKGPIRLSLDVKVRGDYWVNGGKAKYDLAVNSHASRLAGRQIARPLQAAFRSHRGGLTDQNHQAQRLRSHLCSLPRKSQHRDAPHAGVTRRP